MFDVTVFFCVYDKVSERIFDEKKQKQTNIKIEENHEKFSVNKLFHGAIDENCKFLFVHNWWISPEKILSPTPCSSYFWRKFLSHFPSIWNKSTKQKLVVTNWSYIMERMKLIKYLETKKKCEYIVFCACLLILSSVAKRNRFRFIFLFFLAHPYVNVLKILFFTGRWRWGKARKINLNLSTKSFLFSFPKRREQNSR